jgi:hypothetical protein
VNDKNIYNLYSQAYSMRCEKLLKDLVQHIINNLLALDNVVHFLQESIEFEIPSLEESCRGLIIQNFRDIIQTTPDFVYSIPV